MGQYTSKSQGKNVFTSPITEDQKIGTNTKIFNLTEGSCMMMMFSKSRKTLKTCSWKPSTLKKLNALKSEQWANTLTQFLRQTNTQKADAVFKSEMAIRIERTSLKNDFSSNEPSVSIVQVQESPTLFRPNANSNSSGDSAFVTVIGASRNNFCSLSETILNQEDARKATRALYMSDCSESVYSNPDRLNAPSVYHTLYPQTIPEENAEEGSPELKNTPANPLGNTFEKSFEDRAKRIAEKKIENMNRNKSSIRFEDEKLQQSFTSFKRTVLRPEDGLARKSHTIFATITKVLKEHLSNQNHILCQLTKKFTEIITDEYKRIIGAVTIKEVPIEVVETLCAKISRDINQFLKMLCDAIYEFYSFNELVLNEANQCRELEKKDNLINVLVSIFFNEETYKLVFELHKASKSPLEEICSKAVLMLLGSEPQAFELPDELCLNRKTLQIFGTHIAERKNEEDRYIISKTSLHEFVDCQDEVYEEIEAELYYKLSQNVTFKPYQKVIAELLTLQQKQNPCEKLQCLMNAASEIVTCVAEFYADYGMAYNGSLEYKQITAIFLYAIINSGLAEISAHVRMIENFVPKNMLGLSEGWVSMIKISINQLCTLYCNDVNQESSSANSAPN